MASKSVELPDIGTITLSKRRGARHIRLSVSPEGQVRLSLPPWIPYATGIAFAKQKTEWLKSQIKPPIVLRHGMRIGKEHILEFSASKSANISNRVTKELISIKVPPHLSVSHPQVQQIAVRASIRALKQEAEAVLPGRLRILAKQHGFSFRSVEVKRLKSRWGSCNHRQEIVLNCFLMQLPWPLVDYVLLHELMHTRVMAHGPKFWSQLDEFVPELPQARKAIREHRPTVAGAFSFSSMA